MKDAVLATIVVVTFAAIVALSIYIILTIGGTV